MRFEELFRAVSDYRKEYEGPNDSSVEEGLYLYRLGLTNGKKLARENGHH
jgi:hypothetical protein